MHEIASTNGRDAQNKRGKLRMSKFYTLLVGLGVLAASSATAKEDTVPTPPERPSLVAPKQMAYRPLERLPQLSDEEQAILEVLYFEARGEPFMGQLAVFEVAVNRVADPRFPDTFRSVVEDRQYGCQFSYECDGKPERPGRDEWRTWYELSFVAKALYAEWKSGKFDATFACSVQFFHVTGMGHTKKQAKFFGSLEEVGYIGLDEDGTGGHTFYCDPEAGLTS